MSNKPLSLSSFKFQYVDPANYCPKGSEVGSYIFNRITILLKRNKPLSDEERANTKLYNAYLESRFYLLLKTLGLNIIRLDQRTLFQQALIEAHNQHVQPIVDELKREWSRLIACEKGDREFAKSHKCVDLSLELRKKDREDASIGLKYLAYSTVFFTVVLLWGANVFQWYFLQVICGLGAASFPLLGLFLTYKSAKLRSEHAELAILVERQYAEALSLEGVVPSVKRLILECLEKMALKPILAWEQKKIGDCPGCSKEFNLKAFEVHELLTRAQLADFELVTEVPEYQIVENGSDLISLLGLSRDVKNQELLQSFSAIHAQGDRASHGLKYWKETRFERAQIFLLLKCGSKSAVVADCAFNS